MSLSTPLLLLVLCALPAAGQDLAPPGPDQAGETGQTDGLGPDQDGPPAPPELELPAQLSPVPQGSAGPTPTTTELLRAATTPDELQARDARLSFLPSSAVLADAVLAEAETGPELRAAALLAVGCAGSRSDRGRLESWAATGTGLERRAALLALGELGAASAPFLLDQLESEEPEWADTITLALLRTGARSALEAVRDTAAQEGPRAGAARSVRDHHAAPQRSEPTRAHLEYLALRWEAARRFGLVDGRQWSVLLAAELCEDDLFLDLTVLRAGSDWNRPGVRDHLLEVLLTGKGIARVLAAVRGMPEELDQLVQTGLWQPRDPAEWGALVAAAEEEGKASQLRAALSRATSVGLVRQRALSMLMEDGSQHAALLVEAELGSRNPATRAWCAEALGGSGDPKWLADLGRMRIDPDLGVRSAALVAQARLDSATADAQLRDLLVNRAGVNPEDRAAALEALLRVGHDPRLRNLVEQAYALTEGDTQVRFATILARFERSSSREHLRRALSEGLAEPLALGAVRALSANPDGRDLEVLAELYPVEGSRALNAELGRALVDHGTAEGLDIVRAALWRAPWNRSVLAAGLLIQMRGLSGLREELASPPRGVSSRAMRRVGFALGEWGGIQEFEDMARSLRPGEPALQGAYLGALGARTH